MVTSTWATVEQDPTGLWWITTGDTTTGPYLDQVQATRALHTHTETPPTVVVVQQQPPLPRPQCALQTTAAARPETEGGA